MSNGHLPAGSPAMPGGGHGAHGAQPAYNMGGSPVPNGGRALYPSQYPQSRGRGRTQQYSHAAQPQNFYTQQQVQAQAQPTQFSPHIYGSYPQQGYNGMYGYPNQQPYVGYHYNQNGVMPGPYGHPQHQQHYYGQQHVPMQSWYPAASIPHYQLPQSPSINTPYPPPPPMAAVQSPDVVPIPPVVPPPQPTPPAFNPAPQAAPVPATPAPPETPMNQSPSSPQPHDGEAASEPYHFYPQPSENALALAEPEQEVPKPGYQAVPSHVDAQVTSRPTSPVYSPIEPQPGRTWHQIPWSTHPLTDWPKRSKPRRKKKASQALTIDKLQVPQSEISAGSGAVEAVETRTSFEKPAVVDERDDSSLTETTSSMLNVATNASTTSTPEPTSHRSPSQKTSSVPAPIQLPKTTSRSAVPALPVLPALPKDGAVDRSKPAAGHEATDKQDDKAETQTQVQEELKQEEKPAAPAAPKSWAAIAKGHSVSKPAAGQPELNGTATAENASSEIIGTAATTKSSSASLAEALKSFEAGNSGPIHFIEPSGLKNTGTDCYMNSVLQLLLFCTPFYNFLDQIRKNVVHSFKSSSKTPLIDAMIGFISDFRSISAADTPDQLQRKLKPEDHHLLGKAFAPNSVYKVVRELDRFNTPGSQHDAPEFLMLLLNGIEEECERMIRDSATFASGSDQAPFDHHDANGGADASDDWTEVGQRQRLAISQRSGPATIPNPISKIFSGQHREVLRLSRKESVTYNAYQNLSLAIDDPSIKTVIDALKYFHRSEPITSKNSQGIEVNGTKQTLIETLPPILIMHLKRFYVNGGEAEKTWKVVRYPLEFEMPQEILSRQTRNRLLAGGRDLPRYKLTGVVYHHGTSVTSGHYTVDALRQDGQEWLRFDDTMITRISGDAVAEAGVEEANQKSAAATKHERVNETSSNRFAAMGDDDVADYEGDWKQVGPGANGAKKHSSGVNGSSSGTSTPKSKPIRDHKDHKKVAYLLFYQLWN
ncbi:ubiquitin carboxyl-terminal hydrolase [Diaporthe helianthi]|uniref:ubiquitinyl hydrolase 1 n=1 Tax=Diaporthe helianthi TaxID=158607 RepID=A0A2P5HNE5_DIAHE|nr:ubiquitin carboxyl-terminal hydrolase [Diaporthe helianthi]